MLSGCQQPLKIHQDPSPIRSNTVVMSLALELTLPNTQHIFDTD